MPAAKLSSWQIIGLFADKRLCAIFILGITSSMPWVLTGSALSAWLQEAGLTRSAIGYFGSIFVVYAFNWLWAPLVDSINIPFLGQKLGQRKSWVLLCMIIICCCCYYIAHTDPGNNLTAIAVSALLIAFFSATQDVAIDAYRIEIIGNQQQLIPHGAAMATSGWWTGYSLFGAMAFYLADAEHFNWQTVYSYLTISCLALLIAILLMPEQARQGGQRIKELRGELEQQLYSKLGNLQLAKIGSYLMINIIEPFVDFFKKNGFQYAILILSFIFLFKIGEAFLGRMSIVFYKEVGFSNSQIATYSKLVGGGLTILFSIIGGVLNTRFGLIKGLFISGVAMAASNLMFSWIAIIGPQPYAFAATILVDGFTSAFATVTFVAFISSLTGHIYTATQYALMASLGNLGRTTLSATSGELIDFLNGDWALFFVITALMVIPSLILLRLIWRRQAN